MYCYCAMESNGEAEKAEKERKKKDGVFTK